jgi:PHP family Zn ribbon phosphoesterase
MEKNRPRPKFRKKLILQPLAKLMTVSVKIKHFKTIRKTPRRYFRQFFAKIASVARQKYAKICFSRKKLQDFVESFRKLQWVLTRFTD